MWRHNDSSAYGLHRFTRTRTAGQGAFERGWVGEGDKVAVMPSGTAPKPGPLSRAVSAEVRQAMARQRISGTELARMTGRSQGYISKRLRDESSFTANDVEDIVAALGEDLLAFVHAAAMASRRM